MKKIIHIILLFFVATQFVRSQSNWMHVGPKSEIVPDQWDPTHYTQASDNGFETSRLNNITIDPANPLHLFVSGEQAGLWESVDRGAHWSPINTDAIGSNGVSAVTFLNSSEILIGNNHTLGRVIFAMDEIGHRNYSTGIWKYNFVSQTWQTLGPFPNPSGLPYKIRSIELYPNNSSILFACTTIGLFKSTDGGLTWVLKMAGFIENMIFVPYTGGQYCYIAGSNLPGNYEIPPGVLMVMESQNACETFSEISSFLRSLLPSAYSHSRICAKPDDGSNIKFFLYTLSRGSSFDSGDADEYVLSFNKNIVTGVISSYGLLSPSAINNNGTPYRMALDYDPVNDAIWFGGTYLTFFKSRDEFYRFSSVQCKNGQMHNDIHDIEIQAYGGLGGQFEMYVACDGGLLKTILPDYSDGSSSAYFNPLNNGINVCLLNGFSGTDADPNLYAIGGQDIINSDVYDATTEKNRYTNTTWENEGAYIDKFDKNKMFFDASSYSGYYITSEDGGATLTVGKQFWKPLTSAFTPDFTNPDEDGDQTAGFGFSRFFFQDPYRPGRMFYLKHRCSIHQYVYDANDPANSVFVNKISTRHIEPNPGNFGVSAWNIPSAISFSKQTINSLHFVLNGVVEDGNIQKPPGVIKFIGNNIEDSWLGHNDVFTDASNTTPQWTNIAPLSVWSSFGLTLTEMSDTRLIEIETSPWNKDIVYVLLNAPNHPELKVIRYDGANWSNYSNGIPNSEFMYSMIMDHESNDGLYVSTNIGVYYRDANSTSTSWVLYSNGLPKMYSKQMEINYTENTVRAGTYGRGIYKSGLMCPSGPLPPINGCINCNSVTDYFWEGTSISISNTTLNTSKQIVRGKEVVDILPNTTLDPAGNPNVYYEVYIHGCGPGQGNSFKPAIIASPEEIEMERKEKYKEAGSFIVYPNPSNGSFTLSLVDDVEKDVYVYDVMGKIVFMEKNSKKSTLPIDISSQPKGIYLLKVISGNQISTKKIIVE